MHALKPYINVLDPQPVQRFIELTHAAYACQLPPELWQKVDAIFTDEPSFMTQYLPGVAGIYPGKVPVVDQPLFSDRPPAVPWHADLPAQFQALVGYDLLPYVYALFCSESDEAASSGRLTIRSSPACTPMPSLCRSRIGATRTASPRPGMCWWRRRWSTTSGSQAT